MDPDRDVSSDSSPDGSSAFILSLIVPLAAAFVPAATGYRRLPRWVRRITTGAWIAWLAVGMSGWALAFVSDSPDLGFFFIEAAAPSLVGLCVVSLIAALGAVWHTRVSSTPLWHRRSAYAGDEIHMESCQIRADDGLYHE